MTDALNDLMETFFGTKSELNAKKMTFFTIYENFSLFISIFSAFFLKENFFWGVGWISVPPYPPKA